MAYNGRKSKKFKWKILSKSAREITTSFFNVYLYHTFEHSNRIHFSKGCYNLNVSDTQFKDNINQLLVFGVILLLHKSIPREL